jgi:hypothetical protein
MILTGENRGTRRKTCPSATWSTTNPAWTDLGANTDLRGEKPVTNRLSYGTASPVIISYRLVGINQHPYLQICDNATRMRTAYMMRLSRLLDCSASLQPN